MRRALPLLALLALPPSPAAAQRRLVPFVGVAVGGSTLPPVVQACFPDDRRVGEVRLGIEWGALALEGRAAALRERERRECGVADPFVPVNGVHTQVTRPFRGYERHTAGDVRVRLASGGPVPLVVSAGAGWLGRSGLPYLLAGAGLRSRGRVRLAIDAERAWYRAPEDAVTREWREARVVREIARGHRVRWPGGTHLRAGVEVALR